MLFRVLTSQLKIMRGNWRDTGSLCNFKGAFYHHEGASPWVQIRGGEGPTPGSISLSVRSFGA